MNISVILDFSSVYTSACSLGGNRIDEFYDPLGILLNSPQANVRFDQLVGVHGNARLLLAHLCRASLPHVCGRGNICDVLSRATPVDIERVLVSSVRNHHTRYIPTVLECMNNRELYNRMRTALGSRIVSYVEGRTHNHQAQRPMAGATLADVICRVAFCDALQALTRNLPLQQPPLYDREISIDIPLYVPTEESDIAHLKRVLYRIGMSEPNPDVHITADEMVYYVASIRQMKRLQVVLTEIGSLLRLFLAHRESVMKGVLVYINALDLSHDREWVSAVQDSMTRVVATIGHQNYELANEYLYTLQGYYDRIGDVCEIAETLVKEGMSAHYHGLLGQHIAELMARNGGDEVDDVTTTLSTEWATGQMEELIESYRDIRSYQDVITPDSDTALTLCDQINQPEMLERVPAMINFGRFAMRDFSTASAAAIAVIADWIGHEFSESFRVLENERRTRRSTAPGTIRNLVVGYISEYVSLPRHRALAVYEHNCQLMRQSMHLFLETDRPVLGDCLIAMTVCVSKRLLDRMIDGRETPRQAVDD